MPEPRLPAIFRGCERCSDDAQSSSQAEPTADVSVETEPSQSRAGVSPSDDQPVPGSRDRPSLASPEKEERCDRAQETLQPLTVPVAPPDPSTLEDPFIAGDAVRGIIVRLKATAHCDGRKQ